MDRQRRAPGSAADRSMTSTNGQTALCGNHGSPVGSTPLARATAWFTITDGDGKLTFAHTPSLSPSDTEHPPEALRDEAFDAWWGTATMSG